MVWGQRGNFLDVPTDCPQRDERLGWTGDIAVFAPTAAYLFDVNGFLRDWLVDLDAEQRARRTDWCRCRVPDVLKLRADTRPGWPPDTPTAIWSDAAVWVPWALWQAYGDRDGPAAAYPAMAAHVRGPRARLASDNGLWDTGFQFGDWLDPAAPPDEPVPGRGGQGRGRDRLPLSQRVLTAGVAADPRPHGRRGRRSRPSPSGPGPPSTSTT